MIYRDKKTGRFAAKSTWQRSKAHGGTRFVRQKPPPSRFKAPTPSKPAKPIERPIREEKAATAQGQAPKTVQAYIDAWEEADYYEDQGEAESSVDY